MVSTIITGQTMVVPPLGKIHAVGVVNGKTVYVSKGYVNPASAGKARDRWERRVKKQINSGRVFN